jgi:hypothetical protein
MKTNRISLLCRWTAIAALLAFTGCAGYPIGSDGYATGYYNGPDYDSLYGYNDYGYDGFGLGDFGFYPYFDHDHHADRDDHHFVGSHDGFTHQHFASHGAPGGFEHGFGGPHGGFAHSGGFAHIGMGGHGGHARG